MVVKDENTVLHLGGRTLCDVEAGATIAWSTLLELGNGK